MIQLRRLVAFGKFDTKYNALQRAAYFSIPVAGCLFLPMVISERLKQLREEKNLSQGDIEKKTGLLRCYISRVENGHTVPAVQTLEKMAGALEVPMYQLFFEGRPEVLKLPKVTDKDWGGGKSSRKLGEFRRAISKVKKDEDLKLLVFMAQKMSQKTGRSHRKSKA